MNVKLPLFSLVFILLISACRPDNVVTNDANIISENQIFELITAEDSGIDFSNNLTDDPTGVRNVLSWPHYYRGAGVAVGDINGDGLPDIFFASNEGENKLYLNKGDLQFEDITLKSGINNCNKQWSTGAIMADVNGDGLLDIYVCQSGYGILPDRKDRENLLLINNGDLTFSERAAEFGLNDGNESLSAVFFDYDNDGDLDVYVLNESIYALKLYKYVFEELKNKNNLENASGNLYRNDGGKFTKVTEKAGMLRYGYGLGVVASDINNDGFIDLYVTNDYSVPDFMYINNGDGTFTDKIKEYTKNISFFSMGCDIADINNDGLVDIAVVDMATTDHIKDKTLMESMDVEGFWYFVNTLGYQYQYMFNSLQLNNGNNTFSNIAGISGLLKSNWSWAALLIDFDNDGLKDYFVANGNRRYERDNDFRARVAKVRNENGGIVPENRKKDLYFSMPEIMEMNLVYKNNGDLTFTQVSKQWGLPEMTYSNGASYADLDGDGDLELIINNVDQKASIYKNLSREKFQTNYLQIELAGINPEEPVHNSKVTIKYSDKLQYQEMQPTRGYASSMEPILHFGLNEIELIDEIIVVWPNGKETILKDIAVNQRLKINPSDAKNKSAEKIEIAKPFKKINPFSLGIDFVHTENDYNDFATEVLLPHKQSSLSPKISVGDVNGDGLDDFYIGGAKGQSGGLFIQTKEGKFQRQTSSAFEVDDNSEDMGAVFFDADNNGTQDLYVVSGGGGDVGEKSADLQDRFYINLSGNGQFTKVNAIPAIYTSGNVIRSADFDGDGIEELFIGGAAVPGKYPYPERSYILKLRNFKFEDITAQIAPELMKPGIVKDAKWADLNGDGKLDLVIVGEWMPVMIFINENGSLRNASSEYGTEKLKGWWYSVEVADLNNDGKLDIILGNVGLNTKFKASEKEPFYVFADDFDQNGTVDIVLSKMYNGQLVPSRGRECSSEQMPFIINKFPTYEAYATAGLSDILGKDNIEQALKLEVNSFASTVLINKGSSFERIDLPNLAQISPINRIIVDDFNGDKIPDLLIAGNMFETEVETPRYDAGNGLLLIGDGKGRFEGLNVSKSGFFAPHNVKDLAYLRNTASGKPLIIVGNNNDEIQVFEFDPPILNHNQ